MNGPPDLDPDYWPTVVRVLAWVWSDGDAEEVDDSALDLDDERGVVALAIHPVDVEEVGGEQALGLGAQVAPPGILPCQSTDQVDVLIGNRGRPGPRCG